MAIIKVKTGGITADAVTDALIADDVVGTEHLTANEVDTAALGADAVTGAQLADNAVNSEHYTDGSVDTAHIADAQITTAKLSTAVFTGATDIGADLADADLILVDDGAGGTIRKAALSRIKTYAGNAAILQVVTVQDNTTRQTTSGSYTKASNGYDLNITPTSSSSDILLEASFGGGIDAAANRAFFTIFRDSTDIGSGGDGVTTHEVTGSATSSEQSQHLLVVDSPSSTSQITYSIQMKGQGGNTVSMNQKGVGCFVAYEIAG